MIYLEDISTRVSCRVAPHAWPPLAPARISTPRTLHGERMEGAERTPRTHVEKSPVCPGTHTRLAEGDWATGERGTQPISRGRTQVTRGWQSRRAQVRLHSDPDGGTHQRGQHCLGSSWCSGASPPTHSCSPSTAWHVISRSERLFLQPSVPWDLVWRRQTSSESQTCASSTRGFSAARWSP